MLSLEFNVYENEAVRDIFTLLVFTIASTL